MDAQAMQQERFEMRKRVAKPLLWVAIVGMVMFFAGLTSYYLIRQSQGGWAAFDFPSPFYISTILILLSEATMIWVGRSIRTANQKQAEIGMLITMLLGIGFLYQQLAAWQFMVDQGFFFTGEASNVSYSILYVITIAHFLHVIAGIISLSVTYFNLKRGKYSPTEKLGFELASIFWHFLGLLWLYLLLFLVFIR